MGDIKQRKKEVYLKVQTGEISPEEAFAAIKRIEAEPNELTAAGVKAGGKTLTERVCADVTGILAQALKIDQSRITNEQDIRDFGLDSVNLVEFNNGINAAFGIGVPAYAFFEHPNVGEISKFLIQEYQESVKKHYEPTKSDFPEGDKLRPKTEIENTREQIGADETGPDTSGYMWGVRFQSQPITILHADKEFHEQQFLDFWKKLKDRCAETITVSSVSKEQLGLLYDAGCRYFHMLVEVSGGSKMEVYTAGSGKPILFVTGLGLTPEIAFPQIKDWASGNRLIYISMPGVGFSEIRDDLSLTSLTGLIIELLDLLGIDEKLRLVGGSWGTLITAGIAYRYPERVEKMVLSAPLSNRARNRGNSESIYQVSDKLFYDFKNVGAEDSYSLFENGLCIDSLAFTKYIKHFEPDSPSPYSTYDFLDKINVPSLVIDGEKDTIGNRKEFKLIYARMPDCKYAVIRGAGHMPSVTHHEEFGRMVMDFFNQ